MVEEVMDGRYVLMMRRGGEVLTLRPRKELSPEESKKDCLGNLASGPVRMVVSPTAAVGWFLTVEHLDVTEIFR